MDRLVDRLVNDIRQTNRQDKGCRSAMWDVHTNLQPSVHNQEEASPHSSNRCKHYYVYKINRQNNRIVAKTLKIATDIM